MKKRPTQLRTNSRKLTAALVVGLMSAAGLALATAPASQAAPLPAAWSVSNNQAGAAAATYSYDFTTNSTGVIKTVTFAVSGSGLGGVPTISKVYGLGAGTVSISGQTITYTVTNPVSVSVGVGIYVEVAGLTNPAAGSYTTTITTRDATPTVIDVITSGTDVIGGANTAMTATVPKSLTFSSDTPSFQLALDPGLASLADQTQHVYLTIKTNANSGYTLAVSDSANGLQSSSAGNPVMKAVSAGKATSAAWSTVNRFGYTVSSLGATIDPAFANGTKFAGYNAAGETVATRNGPTGGTADAIKIDTRVAIDYAAPAGDYTDIINYTVVGNYS